MKAQNCIAKQNQQSEIWTEGKRRTCRLLDFAAHVFCLTQSNIFFYLLSFPFCSSALSFNLAATADSWHTFNSAEERNLHIIIPLVLYLILHIPTLSIPCKYLAAICHCSIIDSVPDKSSKRHCCHTSLATL